MFVSREDLSPPLPKRGEGGGGTFKRAKKKKNVEEDVLQDDDDGDDAGVVIIFWESGTRRGFSTATTTFYCPCVAGWAAYLRRRRRDGSIAAWVLNLKWLRRRSRRLCREIVSPRGGIEEITVGRRMKLCLQLNGCQTEKGANDVHKIHDKKGTKSVGTFNTRFRKG